MRFRQDHYAAARRRRWPSIVIGALTMLLASCSSLGGSGPSPRAINAASGESVESANIQIVEVTDVVARRLYEQSRAPLFSEVFGDIANNRVVIGRGDVLGITIYESPPALLFGNVTSFGGRGGGGEESAVKAVGASNTVQGSSLPDQMVDDDGRVSVPFAGSIVAAGRTTQQVARTIEARLAGKAHAPQVTVYIANSVNNNVAVVGEVTSNGRVALTPKGERILDVISSAGGVRHPVDKMTIQITRGNRIVAMPMQSIVQNSSQNVRLQSDDVIAALFQPYSFTALGSTGASSEVAFDGIGLTLAQALGRVGGLRDDRANVRGVFVFRFENPMGLDPALASAAPRTPDGRVPVIYRVDMSDPKTLFVAQRFPVRDKDVLYVSSAPVSDLQRFVQMVSSMAFTVIGLGQAVP